MTVAEKLDSIIASQAEQSERQAVMCNDIKHIIKDNLEFQNGVAVFKKDFYNTKATVQKHGIWFAVINGIWVFLLSIWAAMTK